MASKKVKFNQDDSEKDKENMESINHHESDGADNNNDKTATTSAKFEVSSHFPSTIPSNRPETSANVIGQIEIINEEEEEEEEEGDGDTEKKEKEEPSKDKDQNNQEESTEDEKKDSGNTVVISKFTVVNIDEDELNKQETTSPISPSSTRKLSISNNDNASNLNPITSNENINEISEENNNSSSNNNNNNYETDDTDEDDLGIRVEDGYATRQMDEHFRQTIAAIKEELEKKLEKQSMKDTDIDDEIYTDKEGNYFESADEDNAILENVAQTNIIISNRLKINEQEINHWMVATGFLLNNFIIDGFCFIYPVLIESVKEKFNEKSRVMLTLPGILLLFTYLLASPVATFMAKEYGCRKTALFGSLLAAISLLASSFVSSIAAFITLYGVLTGIGLSLVYVSSLMMVSKWFLRSRFFVNCLSMFTSGSACFIFTFLVNYLQRHLILKDVLLIMSAILLNCMVGSMLLLKPFLNLTKTADDIEKGIKDRYQEGKHFLSFSQNSTFFF
jgi:hypothetical protein